MKRAQGTTVYDNSVSNLVRTLLTSTDNPDETEALLRRIRGSLHDPMLIERISFLSDSHPLKQEALIISDAFEAATNGMDNPDAFERLEHIDKSSVFQPWKLLIQGIRAFYVNDTIIMREALENIPGDTPPALLVPTILDLAEGKNKSHNRKGEKNRIEANIIADNSLLSSCIDQLKEALAAGIEDVFTETAMLILREIVRTDRIPAERFVVWSLQAAADHDISPAQLISKLKSIFPQPEVYRLTALSMLKTDPDIALLFWIRFLLSRLHAKDISLQETVTALDILNDINSGAEEILTGEEDREIRYIENLDGLLRTLIHELSSVYPEIYRKTVVFYPGKPSVTIRNIRMHGTFDSRNAGTDDGLNGNRRVKSNAPQTERRKTGGKRTGQIENCPEQLELFA